MALLACAFSRPSEGLRLEGPLRSGRSLLSRQEDVPSFQAIVAIAGALAMATSAHLTPHAALQVADVSVLGDGEPDPPLAGVSGTSTAGEGTGWGEVRPG